MGVCTGSHRVGRYGQKQISIVKLGHGGPSAVAAPRDGLGLL